MSRILTRVMRTIRRFDWRSLIALATLTVLLPGLLATAPYVVVYRGFEIALTEVLFVTIPVLFISLMIFEALGHIRDRNPPSERFN